MLRFTRLALLLESVPFHRSREGLLADYLREAPAADARWALHLLLGGKLPALLDEDALKTWVLARTGLPAWLWEESRKQTADSVETSALLLTTHEPQTGAPKEAPSLSAWLDETARMSAPDWLARWRTLGDELAWTAAVLAIGRFPVRVSRKIAQDACQLASIGDRRATPEDSANSFQPARSFQPSC